MHQDVKPGGKMNLSVIPACDSGREFDLAAKQQDTADGRMEGSQT